ncbi:hypothetical protein C0993_008708 [Termitomyces sp. T159_Od127]|nr:hypothetical protein C0993_008708 [Termitomyces sp. T159_Od127]
MPNNSGPPLKPDLWLQQRLTNLSYPPPQYESSWYGPHNALLSHYFPYQQQFLVKPQSRIRVGPPLAADELDLPSFEVEVSFDLPGPESADDNLNLDEVSFESTGAPVTSRNAAGQDQSYIPDFIVCKATQFTTHDRTLLIAEVKVQPAKSRNEKVKFEVQMTDYMKAYAKSHDDTTANPDMRIKDLYGLLICGPYVQIFLLESTGARIIEQKYTPQLTINSGVVQELLRNIAVENWATYDASAIPQVQQ